MKRFLLATGIAVAMAGAVQAGEQTARYRAAGKDSRLFEQYDIDGYSLEVSTGPDGGLDLEVRVSDAPLASVAVFPTGAARDAGLPAAPERDAFASRAAEGSRTLEEAVRRILLAVASEVVYDPDHTRRQDPAAVFASRRAYCVGFAELSVDLLRREGIRARTVQGVLRTDASNPAYDAAIGGAYHRWIEVYYPDRGFVFSDPGLSINGVDARYVPFSTRALVRPKTLRLTSVSSQGELRYDPVRAGDATVRVRAAR